MSCLLICSAVCSFVGLLLILISLSSDYWVVFGDLHGGLWNICVSSVCSSYGMNVAAVDHAVRAFMLMGMIAGAVSFFALCITLFKSEDAPKISINASILAALCSLIAMAIFTQNSSTTNLFGWSFHLGWASFPLFLIGGVMGYLSRSG